MRYRIFLSIIVSIVISGCSYFSDESMAERYINEGKLDQAYNILTSSKSSTYRKFLLQGIILERKESYSEAVESFNQAIKIYPGELAFFYRGWAFMGLGQYDCAISDFLHATEMTPTKIDALSSLGLAYLQAGNNAMAIKTFQQALDVNNHNIEILTQYVRALYCNNEDAKALNFLLRQTNELQNSPQLEIEKAWILSTTQAPQIKDVDGAQRIADAIAKKHNNLAIVWELLATIEAENGNFCEAIKYIDKALSCSNRKSYEKVLRLEQKSYSKNALPLYRELSRYRPFLIKK